MTNTITDKMLHLAEKWDDQNDARAIFLHCYRMMTANMLLSIERQRFHDNEWVSRLLHRFAEYYFEALTCYDCGDPAPAIWKYTHERALEGRLDEKLIALMITRWRNQVWERALEFCACASAQKQEHLQQVLEKEVMETARWIERVGWQ